MYSFPNMKRPLYPFNLSLSISFYIDVHKYICTHFHIYIISTMYYISICALYFHRRCGMCSWKTSTIFIHIPNVSKQDLYIMYIHLSYHLHRHCGWCWWSTWACSPASCSTLRSGTGCKKYSDGDKKDISWNDTTKGYDQKPYINVSPGEPEIFKSRDPVVSCLQVQSLVRSGQFGLSWWRYVGKDGNHNDNGDDDAL